MQTRLQPQTQKQELLTRYMEALLLGDRVKCRAVIDDVLHTGIPANQVYLNVIWPVMNEIERLYRLEQISPVQEGMATRINRTIVDQLQNKLPRKIARGKRVIISCADTESAELGAQIMGDILESDGWEVRFLGCGVCIDDILTFANEYKPDVLLIYGTKPQAAPNIRQLIDVVREVNALPDLKIMVSGGVFGRAEGLWQEIGADMFAADPAEAVQVVTQMREGNLPEPVRMINCRGRQSAARSRASKKIAQPV